MKVFICVLLYVYIASVTTSDEHRPKLKVKEADDNRGKRNLEYQISHNYPIGANFRLERRISSNSNFQLPSRYPQFFPAPRPHHYRGRPHSIPAPPYAVQMEPLVQYSQRDPLYDSSKLPLTADGHNELSKPDDLLTDNNHLSEHVFSHQNGGPYGGHHGGHDQLYYQKEPEPIIEIIIKESNVTLPPIPVPTAPPKKKEPVQVFYVKYKKNPNGYGKDSVIYDKPVPALTPHVQEDHEEQPQLDQPHQEYVTAIPPPSTTLRTIIRPDSETYIGTSGIHVTFGSDHKKGKTSPEGHEESAPQPAVVFPQPNQGHQHFHQQQINHFNHHHQQQQQPQFSQPIPEKRPATSAFPPNFNPPVNFNQQNFGPPRPGGPPAPPQFNNQQYRPVHQQPARPFPILNPNNQHQPRHPGGVGPQRPFQQPPFVAHQHQRPPGPPGPLGPPQPLNPPHRQQFPPNKEFERPPQFQTANHQFGGQNHHNQFGGNSQFPSNQFNNFQQQHFPPKQQFAQLLSNHRPQTHFPVVQNNQFNQKLNQAPGGLQQHTQHHNQQHAQQQLAQQQHIQQQQQQHAQQQQQAQQQQHAQQQVRINQQNQPPQSHQFAPHNNRPGNAAPQQPNQQFNHQQQQHVQQQQQHFQAPHVIPPGGELVKSVPRYEQHISVPADQPATSIQNAHDIRPQALPQVQLQPQPSSPSPLNVPFNNNPHVNQQQSYQQLQSQLQQQINLQVQQQLQHQPKILSTQDFQHQINQQFQFPLQNFAQLTTLQNKQSQDQVLTSPGIQQHQSLPPDYYLNNNAQFPHIYHPQSTTTSLPTSTPKLVYVSSTTPSTTTTRTTTNRPVEKTEEKKGLKIPSNIILPDEVPDDLREQLLSSGILNNADISVLDYDKVGDIPIDALPPDQLANFYGAGGAQQIAASERKAVVIRTDGEAVLSKDDKVDMDQELSAEESERDETIVPNPDTPPKQVRMKVVHYDSESDDGRDIHDSYVRQDATHVDPVVLNDNKYNRYLPLKVSGAQFPIPDVPELKGKNITSVVVLAPVDYEFHQRHGERNARDIEGDIKDVQFRAGEDLKTLLMNPSKENYKRWLDSEKQATTDKQSVVLLVAGSPESQEKEIFMYDVSTKTVSKLSGELSSAFVEAAESNADDEIVSETVDGNAEEKPNKEQNETNKISTKTAE